jgi:hypothetical protein
MVSLPEPQLNSVSRPMKLKLDVRMFECFSCDNIDKVTTETKRGSTLSAWFSSYRR